MTDHGNNVATMWQYHGNIVAISWCYVRYGEADCGNNKYHCTNLGPRIDTQSLDSGVTLLFRVSRLRPKQDQFDYEYH